MRGLLKLISLDRKLLAKAFIEGYVSLSGVAEPIDAPLYAVYRLKDLKKADVYRKEKRTVQRRIDNLAEDLFSEFSSLNIIVFPSEPFVDHYSALLSQFAAYELWGREDLVEKGYFKRMYGL